MKTLTVFTPTYNRAELLERNYNSLCQQTSNDFEWLVIDDGSTDNTKAVVEKWIKENKIKITYIYKENGGLASGYNKAIENIDTELAVCIDSDDFMPNDAVEKIITFWREKGGYNYAGIMGYDYLIESDTPIGGEFPQNLSTIFMVEVSTKYHHGDVKTVYRTDLLKKVAPIPIFDNEKNMNPVYLSLKIDLICPLLLLRENLCYVDYQSDGMMSNLFQQYWNSPKSFAELRRIYMSHPNSTMLGKIKNAIHYTAESLIAKDSSWLKKSPKKNLTIFFSPMGFILFIFIKYNKNKKLSFHLKF